MSPPACAITPEGIQRLARTPRRNRRPPGADRPPQAEITARPSPKSVAFGEEVTRKLAEVEDRDEISENTSPPALAEASKAYQTAAQALSAERRAAAAKLAKLAEAQINSLAMKVRFEVVVAATEHESHWTLERLGTSLNTASRPTPASRSKPLHEIASGGEMSRVMLALKVSVRRGRGQAQKEDADSAHAGPSTKSTLASADVRLKPSARKLKSLSRGQQVLLRDAPASDRSLRRPALPHRQARGRRSHQDQGYPPRRRARTHEVARMVSGAKVTDTSLHTPRR